MVLSIKCWQHENFREFLAVMNSSWTQEKARTMVKHEISSENTFNSASMAVSPVLGIGRIVWMKELIVTAVSSRSVRQASDPGQSSALTRGIVT